MITSMICLCNHAVYHFTLNIDVTVNTTYSGITILQGYNITLSCRPSPSDIALQWSYIYIMAVISVVHHIISLLLLS